MINSILLRMSRCVAALAFSVFLIGLTATAAQACSCWQPTPEEHILKTDVVLKGTVVALEDFDPPSRFGGKIAVVQVDRVWKGPRTDRIRISSGTSIGAMCGWGFALGTQGIFFANQKGDAFSTDYCRMIPYVARERLHHEYDAVLEAYRTETNVLVGRVREAPDDRDALVMLIDRMLAFKDAEGAALYVERLAQLAPGTSPARLRSAEVLLGRKRLPEALTEFDAVLAVQPDDDRARHGRTMVLVGQGRIAEAVAKTRDFSGMSVNGLELSGLERPGMNFRQANLSGVFSSADLSRSDFRDARVYGDFRNARMIEADFRKAELYAEFPSADLSRSDFRDAEVHADFRNARLTGVDFRGATISLSKFEGTELREVHFESARLYRSDLLGADFSGAILEDANFYGSQFDCTTIWPKDFNPVAAGAWRVADTPEVEERRRTGELPACRWPPPSACKLERVPNNAVISFVGAYEGKALPTRRTEHTGNNYRRIDVAVTRTDRPTILILSSYEPVEWRIGWIKGADVAGVFVTSGSGVPVITGLPRETPVILNGRHKEEADCALSGVQSFSLSRNEDGSEPRNEDRSEAHAAIGHVIGRLPDEYDLEYSRSRAVVGPEPFPEPKRLIHSTERGPVFETDPDLVYTGEEGIAQLVSRGVIRTATPSELSVWLQGAVQRHGKAPDIQFEQIYVLMREAELPGGTEAVFIVPEGIRPLKSQATMLLSDGFRRCARYDGPTEATRCQE